MSFNNGWMCDNCGPVEESKERSINKVKHKCCKICGGIVKPWARPDNERSGRCGNCANGSFKLAITKHRLLRCCKKCGEVVDTEIENHIVREGDKKHEYKTKTR